METPEDILQKIKDYCHKDVDSTLIIRQQHEEYISLMEMLAELDARNADMIDEMRQEREDALRTFYEDYIDFMEIERAYYT